MTSLLTERPFRGLVRPGADRGQFLLQFELKSCHFEAPAGPWRFWADFYCNSNMKRPFGSLGRSRADRGQFLLKVEFRNYHLEALAGPGRIGASFVLQLAASVERKIRQFRR